MQAICDCSLRYLDMDTFVYILSSSKHMTTEENKQNDEVFTQPKKAQNSFVTVLAIILLTVYFITDFLVNPQILVAILYIIIVAICISICTENVSFYKNIYNIVIFLVVGEFFKNCIVNFTNLGWIVKTLTRQFKFQPLGRYLIRIFETPYIYFYLVGILLWAIHTYAPTLCQSKRMKDMFSILGRFAFRAVILHMISVNLIQYGFVDDAIFIVFIISAFWNAYINYDFSDFSKSVGLVIIITLFASLYPEQYQQFLESFKNIFKITESVNWIFIVGMIVICILCILSKEVMQDIVVGFVLLGTNLILLYGALNKMDVDFKNVVILNIIAISCYYLMSITIHVEYEIQKKRYTKLMLAFSYMMALLFSIFIQNHMNQSIAMLCVGLVFSFLYFSEFIKVKGSVYGTAIFGAIPWILLEITINSLGKLHVSILSAILFTILFWCTCGVALSWKDAARIKSIVFEEGHSEKILNVLSGIAYFATAFILFL